MASRKRKRPEDHIDAIADVRDRGVLSEDDVPVLLSGIDSGHFRVVAFAARVLKNLGDEDTWARLEPRLLPAFKELIGDAKRPGHKKDPGCKAKLAIAEALADGMRPTDDVFSVGLSLVQYEPVFEGKEDSAASVRAACALGLAHMAHADAVLLISDLLADPEKIARVGAAMALGVSGRAEARPVLRLKARLRDSEPEVTHAVFHALLSLSSHDQALVEEALIGEDEGVFEAAALALGDSHRPSALAPLQGALERTVEPQRRRILLQALCALRTDESEAFLSSIEQGVEGDDALRSVLRSLRPPPVESGGG